MENTSGAPRVFVAEEDYSRGRLSSEVRLRIAALSEKWMDCGVGGDYGRGTLQKAIDIIESKGYRYVSHVRLSLPIRNPSDADEYQLGVWEIVARQVRRPLTHLEMVEAEKKLDLLPHVLEAAEGTRKDVSRYRREMYDILDSIINGTPVAQ